MWQPYLESHWYNWIGGQAYIRARKTQELSIESAPSVVTVWELLGRVSQENTFENIHTFNKHMLESMSSLQPVPPIHSAGNPTNAFSKWKTVHESWLAIQTSLWLPSLQSDSGHHTQIPNAKSSVKRSTILREIVIDRLFISNSPWWLRGLKTCRFHFWRKPLQVFWFLTSSHPFETQIFNPLSTMNRLISMNVIVLIEK
jgi:hypothetical protein